MESGRAPASAGVACMLIWARLGLLRLHGLHLYCIGDAKSQAVEAEDEGLGAEEADSLGEEELDQNGIGGGGVATESRPAVFGAANHAEDVQQPVWARVGLVDPALQQRDHLKDEPEGAGQVAREQQHLWMDER